MCYILKSRFWTRNRPGDTIVDKTDEVSMPRANERVTGIIFKNIDLQGIFLNLFLHFLIKTLIFFFVKENDTKNEGSVSLPGLGLDEEVITALNNSGMF